MKRRTFCKGAASTALWISGGCGGESTEKPASILQTRLLSAARDGGGRFGWAELDFEGQLHFHPSPGRLHAIAHHANGAVAAVDRRPGYAIHLSGPHSATLNLSPRFQFQGHACFSSDGAQLFTTEAERSTSRGFVGVWDVETAKLLGRFETGGLGPHELLVLSDSGEDLIVVANGGLHAPNGQPINLETMQSSVVSFRSGGQPTNQHEITTPKASFRHIAPFHKGVVGAFQIQVDALPAEVPLPLALVWDGAQTQVLEATAELAFRMEYYVGSVAVHEELGLVGLTSPRGNYAAFFRLDTGTFVHGESMSDVSGIARLTGEAYDFVLSSSTGELRFLSPLETNKTHSVYYPVAFDNHLHPLDVI